MKTLECSECGASNTPGSAFCEACGRKLSTPRRADAKDSAPPPPPQRLREQQDRRTVARAQATLNGARGLYGVLALLGLLIAWLAWLGYLDAEQRTFAGFVVLALLTAEAGLNLAGFLFFRANPLVWTTVLAGLQTVNLALMVLTTEAWSRATIFVLGTRALLTTALWCAVPVTARVTRIWEQQAKERAGARSGSASTRAEARELKRHRAGLRQFALVASAVMAFAIVAAWLPYRSSVAAADAAERAEIARNERVLDFEPTLRSFRAAWNASDLAAVKSAFSPASQRTVWPSFEKRLAQKDWATKLPQLAEPEAIERGGEVLDAHFPIDRTQQLKTRWTWVEGNWRIERVLITGRS